MPRPAKPPAARLPSGTSSKDSNSEPGAAERLLSAAVEAFGERGYRATTTREIADRAGMSPAGVYIHFQSKQDVLYQVTRRGHYSVLQVVEDALAAEAPPEVQVRRFVEAFATWHAWNHRAARIQQYELKALAPEHYAEIRDIRSRFGYLLTQELRRGVQSGTFKIDDLETTSRAILSLGIDIARWYHQGVKPDPETLGRQYGTLVLQMLGVNDG